MEKQLYYDDYVLNEILLISEYDQKLFESQFIDWIKSNFDSEEKIKKNLRKVIDLVKVKNEDFIRKIFKTIITICIGIGAFALLESMVVIKSMYDIESDVKTEKVVNILKDEIKHTKKNRNIFNIKEIKKVKLKSFNDLMKAVGERESSEQWDIVNSGGYMGYFQLGKTALMDIGMSINNEDEKQAFLKNPNIQRKAFKKLLKRNKQILDVELEKGFDYYLGKEINDIIMTKSGMLLGSHLVGAGAMRTFLESNGDTIPKDGNKVPVTEYIELFADYHIPY